MKTNDSQPDKAPDPSHRTEPETGTPRSRVRQATKQIAIAAQEAPDRHQDSLCSLLRTAQHIERELAEGDE